MVKVFIHSLHPEYLEMDGVRDMLPSVPKAEICIVINIQVTGVRDWGC